MRRADGAVMGRETDARRGRRAHGGEPGARRTKQLQTLQDRYGPKLKSGARPTDPHEVVLDSFGVSLVMYGLASAARASAPVC